QREEKDRPEVRNRRRRDEQLSEVRRPFARVLEDRRDDAERGGRQTEREEHRRLDHADRLKRDRDHVREHDREREANRRDLQALAAQQPHVELEADEKQQERKADQRQDADGLVDRDPFEAGRTDRDARENLQDNRRQAHLRHHAQEQRRHERHHADDYQPCKRQADLPEADRIKSPAVWSEKKSPTISRSCWNSFTSTSTGKSRGASSSIAPANSPSAA